MLDFIAKSCNILWESVLYVCTDYIISFLHNKISKLKFDSILPFSYSDSLILLSFHSTLEIKTRSPTFRFLFCMRFLLSEPSSLCVQRKHIHIISDALMSSRGKTGVYLVHFKKSVTLTNIFSSLYLNRILKSLFS